MKALRKTKKGKGNVSIQEVPEPRINADEVLMKVWTAGVCGSDLLIDDDKHFYSAPVTLAHEFSGVAWEVGENVKKIKVGDHIVGDIETPTGWLGVTRDGAYAPYMSMPENVCYKLPEDFNLDHGAMTELVTAIIHIMQERTLVKAGDFVVIVGPGPMGLLGVQFAKIRGASKVVLIGLKKDNKRLISALKGGKSDKVPFFDNYIDDEIVEKILGYSARDTCAAIGDPFRGDDIAKVNDDLCIPMDPIDYKKLYNIICQDSLMLRSAFVPFKREDEEGRLKII